MQDIYQALINVAKDQGLLHRPLLPEWKRCSTLYYGYEASPNGYIRERSSKYLVPDSWLAPPGLPMVELLDTYDQLYAVSRAEVILDTFVGSPADRKSVMFRDGDTRNSNIFNLAWILKH